MTCTGCEAQVRIASAKPGARYQCPRCGSTLIAPGQPSATDKAAQDELGAASTENALPRDSARRQEVFYVTCPLCKALCPAKPSQIGKPITCGDCLEEFVVQKPTDGGGDLFPSDVPASPTSSATDALFPSPGESPSEDRFPPEDDWSMPAAQEAPHGAEHESDDEPWPSAAGEGKEEVYEFTVVCPLCGTRLEATTTQIGDPIRCPDCHLEFAIRQPRPSELRPISKRSATSDYDGELKLRDEPLPPRPLVTPPLPINGSAPANDDESWPASASTSGPSDPAETFPEDIRKQLADDLLSKARGQKEEIEAQLTAIPHGALTPKLFDFLADAAAITQWVILTVGWGFEVQLILQAAAHANYSDAITAFICLAMITGAGLVGLGVSVVGSSNLLTVLRDTSAGRDTVEAWPGFNPTEMFGDFVFVAMSAFYSIMPGFIMGQLAFSVLGAPFEFLIAATVLSGYLFFPFLLISALENGSPFIPVSPEVNQSLSQTGSVWAKFYLVTLVITGLAVLSVAVQIFGGCLFGWLGAGAAVLMALIYFRLLGRLTWNCSEAIAKQSEE